MVARAPIGIFDSGIGGLTVASAIRQALPAERLLYFGDIAHIPYGDRSLREVRAFSAAIVRALMAKGCKMIVIACNTASAAALKEVRQAWPRYPFIGMEPAVKPAAERSRSNVVGVIATRATFQGELFASVVERFAQGVTVLEQPCPGLVQAIEAGELDTPGTEQMLRGWLEPMLARGMDELVLACVRRAVAAGDHLDPAPAVARRVKHVLGEPGLLATEGTGGLHVAASRITEELAVVLDMLGLKPDAIAGAEWRGGEVMLP